MLKLTQLSLRRGPRLLLERADLQLNPGEKLGLTGGNGCGKSSLFALIRGEIGADEGDFSLPPDWVIAHVAQETPALERPAIDYVLDGDAELREVEQSLAKAEAGGDGHAQGALHERLAAIDGYSARARAARLMHGLGFRPGEEERPVSAFSGGWRMRLNLAQALMCRSDLLLLDEPTNHLDLDAVLWLEEWLLTYRGTLMLISHDRDFLDRVVGRIVHIEQGRLNLYSGNYSDFERQRAERLAQQQGAFEKQQRERAHMQDFVRRFRAKATKARQAQSRLKALERMQEIAPAHVDSPFHFEFREPHKLPDPLLQLQQAAVGYGDTPLLKGMKLSLHPGQRIGLLGINGAGKSTLIKLLAGNLMPLSGERLAAQELKLGYFAQHQLEQLDPEASPLLHLQRLDGKAREQELRDFLGGFGFNGDRALDTVAPFSGGEKARLALALLVYQRPNLLLLDEPTNHLDLEMRHALNLALQEFDGALLLVSHDRHLIRSVCDELWLVADGNVQPFDGDLEAYRQELRRRAREQESTEAKPVKVNNSHELRKQLKPLRNRSQKLEREVEALEAKLTQLDERLGDPSSYDDKDALAELMAKRGEVATQLNQSEEQWMEVEAEIEALEKELK